MADATSYEPGAGSGGGGVPTSREIATTSPLTGGGDLSTNRTISHAASGVTANTYPSPSSVTVDAQGHVTAITAGSGGGGDALTDLGVNPSVTPLAPGKYLITGGASGALILTVGAVGDYWRIVVADNGVTTAGNIYAAVLCHFRLDGADHTEIGYDTGAGYCAFEFWKTSETRYNVLAIKAAGGQT